jgi:hypothetical protein
MWKWTIKFDKAFEIPTYRVKADGFIVGTIRQFDLEWSWELTLPLQTAPDWCKGTRPTREQCQDAIREAVQRLTKGLDKEAALRVLLQGITGR